MLCRAVCAPDGRRRALLQLTVELAGLPRVTRKCMEMWCGLVTPILTHRRETSAALHGVYRWLSALAPGAPAAIPTRLRSALPAGGPALAMGRLPTVIPPTWGWKNVFPPFHGQWSAAS